MDLNNWKKWENNLHKENWSEIDHFSEMMNDKVVQVSWTTADEADRDSQVSESEKCLQ